MRKNSYMLGLSWFTSGDLGTGMYLQVCRCICKSVGVSARILSVTAEGEQGTRLRRDVKK
jgi:hypothetical protein